MLDLYLSSVRLLFHVYNWREFPTGNCFKLESHKTKARGNGCTMYLGTTKDYCRVAPKLNSGVEMEINHANNSNFKTSIMSNLYTAEI